MNPPRRRVGRWVALAAVAVVALTGAASAAQAVTVVPNAPVVVFDSVPSPLPGNYPSLGYTATSTRESGDALHLAGTARSLDQVTVAMSSWACEVGGGATCVTTPGATFDHDLTLTVYAVDGDSPGALLTTITTSFAIPFRPSADPTNCGGGTSWQPSAGARCVNGKAFTVTFDPTDAVVLPDDVLVTVSYETSHDGLPSGPYDSLNVGLPATTASVGSFADPADLWLSSTSSDTYSTVGDLGVLRRDATGWDTYQPGITVTATAPSTAAPTPTDTSSPTPTPTPTPTGGTYAPTDADLAPGAQGGFTLPPSAPVGSTVPLTFAVGHAGQSFDVYEYSTPTALGTHTVSADGTMTVTLSNTLVGQHRIAAYTADGTLIGWQYIQVLAAPELAATGANLTALVGAGVLLLAGAGLVLARRRLA